MAAPLAELAERASLCERRALEAERDIVSLKKCQFMAGHLGGEYRGFVVSVQPFGFFVELEEYFVEGLVHVAALGDDYYQFDDATHSLIGMSRRRRFSIGDQLTVLVHRVDAERREIDFRLSEAQSPAPPPRQGRTLRRARRGMLAGVPNRWPR
jgi:ribonuclease R